MSVGVVHVHLAAEHTTELKLGQVFFQALQLGHNVVDGAFVVFLDGHVEQVLAVGQAIGQFVQGLDDLRQHGALTAQALSVLGLVPDGRVFQFAIDFDQAISFLIVVKDTPNGLGAFGEVLDGVQDRLDFHGRATRANSVKSPRV